MNKPTIQDLTEAKSALERLSDEISQAINAHSRTGGDDEPKLRIDDETSAAARAALGKLQTGPKAALVEEAERLQGHAEYAAKWEERWQLVWKGFGRFYDITAAISAAIGGLCAAGGAYADKPTATYIGASLAGFAAFISTLSTTWDPRAKENERESHCKTADQLAGKARDFVKLRCLEEHRGYEELRVEFEKLREEEKELRYSVRPKGESPARLAAD